MLHISISLCDVVGLPTLAIGTLSTYSGMDVISSYFICLVRDALPGRFVVCLSQLTQFSLESTL